MHTLTTSKYKMVAVFLAYVFVSISLLSSASSEINESNASSRGSLDGHICKEDNCNEQISKQNGEVSVSSETDQVGKNDNPNLDASSELGKDGDEEPEHYDEDISAELTEENAGIVTSTKAPKQQILKKRSPTPVIKPTQNARRYHSLYSPQYIQTV